MRATGVGILPLVRALRLRPRPRAPPPPPRALLARARAYRACACACSFARAAGRLARAKGSRRCNVRPLPRAGRRYVLASHVARTFQAILTGLAAAFCMDVLHNPPHLRHASASLAHALADAPTRMRSAPPRTVAVGSVPSRGSASAPAAPLCAARPEANGSALVASPARARLDVGSAERREGEDEEESECEEQGEGSRAVSSGGTSRSAA